MEFIRGTESERELQKVKLGDVLRKGIKKRGKITDKTFDVCLWSNRKVLGREESHDFGSSVRIGGWTRPRSGRRECETGPSTSVQESSKFSEVSFYRSGQSLTLIS